jgi:hypothetical protein
VWSSKGCDSVFIEEPPSPALREQRKPHTRQDLLQISGSGILSEQDWNVGAKVISVTGGGAVSTQRANGESLGIIDFCRDGGVSE